MRKTIETIDGKPVIHTVNGVDTRTGAIYVREVPVTTPLPNGFNQELAELVFDQISRLNAASGGTANSVGDFDINGWYQSEWRVPLRNVGTVVTTLGLDIAPTCGTAMCFAGWVGELTAADWVADEDIMATRGMEGYWADLVLLPKEAAKRINDEVCFPAESSTLFFGAYSSQLRKRGFTSDTHSGVRVSTYAQWQLGLVHGDYLGLFDGGNTISMIRDVIDLYTEFGPKPNVEAREASYKAKNLEFQWDDLLAYATQVEESMEDYLGYSVHGNCTAARA